jgi:hypothetical protein
MRRRKCGENRYERVNFGKEAPTEAAFADLIKIDHTPITEKGHTRIMVAESKTLTREEFASQLKVGNRSAVNDPPTNIPFEHEVRLIMLGYMADVSWQAADDHARSAAHSSGI